MIRPLSRQSDFTAGLSLAVGLHLAALLALGGRVDVTPPVLAPPAATRVAIRLMPRPPAVQPVVTPQPEIVPDPPAPSPVRVVSPVPPQPPAPVVPEPEPKPTPAIPDPPKPPDPVQSIAAVQPPPHRDPPPAAPKPVAVPEHPVPAVQRRVVEAETKPIIAEVPEPANQALPEVAAPIDRDNQDGDFDVAPKPRRAIRPVYPLRARQRGESGRVTAVLHVSAKGRVEHVAIAESSGYESLDRAARQALLAARFDPARRGEAAVPARVRLTIVFELKG